jgi:hypothetical protein
MRLIINALAKGMVLTCIILLGLCIMSYAAENVSVNSKSLESIDKGVTAQQKIEAPLVLVPDLMGKTKGEAEKALQKIGLKAGKIQYTTSGKGKAGTVVKQKPEAEERLAKGGEVDLWIMKSMMLKTTGVTKMKMAKFTPKLFQEGKKAYLEFPGTVKDVIISDRKGKKLQKFKSGKKFDITESILKNKGGKIKVAFTPSPMPGIKGGPPSPVPQNVEIDPSDYFDPDILKPEDTKKAMLKPQLRGEMVTLDKDNTTMENSEPGNNTHNGAPLVSAGLYAGTVGDTNDPTDMIRVTSGPGGIGSLIWVSVFTGNVNIALFGPANNFLAGWDNSAYIAIEPNISVYFSIVPKTSGGPVNYIISVSTRELIDDNEDNDMWFLATKLSGWGPVTATGLLFNVEDNLGLSHVDRDYFKYNIGNADKRIRITVTNVELPSPGGFDIYVHEPSTSPDWVAHTWGTTSATLDVDLPTLYASKPFPSGYWLVDLKPRTWGPHHGKGIPSAHYKSPGYQITVEKLP